MKKAFKYSFLFLFALLAASLIVSSGCEKKTEELPSIFENPSFGNKNADIFFNKDKLQEFGIKGKLVASVMIKGVPQLVLFDTESQETRILTTGGEWNRAPSFSLDGNKIFFASSKEGRSSIMVIDLKTGEETTVATGDEDRYDPVPIGDNKIVYNVFPPDGNFYLVELDLETGKETTLTLTAEGIEGNLAVRAAEPAYDPETNTLFFVNDLAFDGKPAPINIWKADLETGKVERISHNEIIQVYEINGVQVSSPQFFDISPGFDDALFFCMRSIGQHTPTETPHLEGVQVHYLKMDSKKDEILVTTTNRIRSPIPVTEKYYLLADPEHREIALLNVEDEKQREVFISTTAFVGDFDFHRED